MELQLRPGNGPTRPESEWSVQARELATCTVPLTGVYNDEQLK